MGPCRICEDEEQTCIDAQYDQGISVYQKKAYKYIYRINAKYSYSLTLYDTYYKSWTGQIYYLLLCLKLLDVWHKA